jgi:serine/threonine-protein kinase
MSPEQCEGASRVDHRSDIYALGVVMYHLLAGRVPFDGEGVGDVIVGHMTRLPERPSAYAPGVPEEIEAIVLHALEKRKERRFQSMEEMGAALAHPTQHLEEYRKLAAIASMATIGPTSAPLGEEIAAALATATAAAGARPSRSQRARRRGRFAFCAAAFGIVALLLTLMRALHALDACQTTTSALLGARPLATAGEPAERTAPERTAPEPSSRHRPAGPGEGLLRARPRASR